MSGPDGLMSWEESHALISQSRAIPAPSKQHVQQLAASISKMAAKADDETLVKLSTEAEVFLGWLGTDDVLTRAYSACILANIAFLQQGQMEILGLGGVSMLVRIISRKEDRKVILHCVAALQNLTYKNADCCVELIDKGDALPSRACLRHSRGLGCAGGEKALKKLLKKSPDEAMHQYAAGAVANLMLYRSNHNPQLYLTRRSPSAFAFGCRNPNEWNLHFEGQGAPTCELAPQLAPAAENPELSKPRKPKHRGGRKNSSGTPNVGGREGGEEGVVRVEAALLIQRRYRWLTARRERAKHAEASKREHRFGHSSHGIGVLCPPQPPVLRVALPEVAHDMCGRMQGV
ncbi:MAG: hypothetical protein SGPRY_013864 [Prymnesium sp.]